MSSENVVWVLDEIPVVIQTFLGVFEKSKVVGIFKKVIGILDEVLEVTENVLEVP